VKLIIDANIVIAALIKQALTAKLILDDSLELIAPAQLKQEVTKYAEYILKKSKCTQKELDLIQNTLFKAITLVPYDVFYDSEQQAEAITPDVDDTIYIALAIHLKCPLWSNDKALKNQTKVRILSTAELLAIMQNE